MFYRFELNEFPVIKGTYTVTRNTIWQLSEKENLIILITDGSCSFSSGGETIIAEPGDIIFIPAGNSYVRNPINKSMCTMIYVHFTLKTDVMQEEITRTSLSILEKIKEIDGNILNGESDIEYPRTIYVQFKNPSNLAEMSKFFNNLNRFSSKRQFMYDMQSSITLCNILALLSQETVDTILANAQLSDIPSIPHNLKKAISYINHNYSQPISLNDLSLHCNISKQQLIRYFKNSFNTTPLGYITQFKIAKAKEFLFRSPNLNIKEIAAALGFENQHYFSRTFSKATGETPSQYRFRTMNYNSSAETSLPSSADL